MYEIQGMSAPPPLPRPLVLCTYWTDSLLMDKELGR